MNWSLAAVRHNATFTWVHYVTRRAAYFDSIVE